MATVVTLKSGLRVANFSSPHPFTFTTGEVLPAVPPEDAQALMLEAIERETIGISGTIDISLSFKMSTAVKAVLDHIARDPNIDICIVPLPVMTALKEAGYSVGKFRTCRVADRVTKTIHPDRFCK